MTANTQEIRVSGNVVDTQQRTPSATQLCFNLRKMEAARPSAPGTTATPL
jgi:hypothetical protein